MKNTTAKCIWCYCRMVSRWALNWEKANNAVQTPMPIHRLCTQTFSHHRKQTHFWGSNLWHLCLAGVPVTTTPNHHHQEFLWVELDRNFTAWNMLESGSCSGTLRKSHTCGIIDYLGQNTVSVKIHTEWTHGCATFKIDCSNDEYWASHACM